ncbi:MAG: hypothetical protein FJ029_02945, partial [Actinobacteria bacterium]|nr:hypothetical protein [Actinomycetota bacterium]
MVGVSVALPSAPRASRFVLDGPALKEAVALGLAAAVGFVTIVGVVTDAIDVPFFVRRTPLLAVDYPIWALNALLLGFLVGLGHYARRMRVGLGSGAVYGGGFLAAFAVSCPACNGLLLAALGSSGVAAYVEPVRPF